MNKYIKNKGIEAICEEFNYSLASIKLYLKTNFPNASNSNICRQMRQFKEYIKNKNKTERDLHLAEILKRLAE